MVVGRVHLYGFDNGWLGITFVMTTTKEQLISVRLDRNLKYFLKLLSVDLVVVFLPATNQYTLTAVDGKPH